MNYCGNVKEKQPMLWAKMIFVSGKHGILILCLISFGTTVNDSF